MKILVAGCLHGEVERLYDTVLAIEERRQVKIDLVLCCGDFQAVRNEADLPCMAVPPKYRRLNTFYK